MPFTWAVVAVGGIGWSSGEPSLAFYRGPGGGIIEIEGVEEVARLRLVASPDLAAWDPMTPPDPDGWRDRPIAGWPEPFLVMAPVPEPGEPRVFYRLEFETGEPPFLVFVTVGDPGNAEDPRDGDRFADGDQHFGSVAETFRLSAHETTNAHYAAFLSSVAAESDPHGLFDPEMGSNERGGIARTGSEGAYQYSVREEMAFKPVIFVSFWDACRFCNWLHHGMPVGAAGAASTETGAYDLTDPAALSANTVTRSPDARFFLPSEDQWYKAAYFDPARDDGAGGYWLYPTRSDAAPAALSATLTGDLFNPAGVGGANHDLGAKWGGLIGHVTTVGSGGAGTATAYGAYDMAGNVYEWNESLVDDEFRVLRGGSWISPAEFLESPDRDGGRPNLQGVDIGFRVAAPAETPNP